MSRRKQSLIRDSTLNLIGNQFGSECVLIHPIFCNYMGIIIESLGLPWITDDSNVNARYFAYHKLLIYCAQTGQSLDEWMPHWAMLFAKKIVTVDVCHRCYLNTFRRIYNTFSSLLHQSLPLSLSRTLIFAFFVSNGHVRIHDMYISSTKIVSDSQYRIYT